MKCNCVAKILEGLVFGDTLAGNINLNALRNEQFIFQRHAGCE